MAASCREGGGIAWIGLYRPTHEEFADVAREFELHELAVEDAVNAHQRPKLERYGETLFCVLRPARYIDETETVEFGEVHVFAGPQFVITVRHSEAPDLAARAPRPGGAPRPAAPRPRGDPSRDPGPRGRRLRARRGRRRERHRRDRGRGVRRRRADVSRRDL